MLHEQKVEAINWFIIESNKTTFSTFLSPEFVLNAAHWKRSWDVPNPRPFSTCCRCCSIEHLAINSPTQSRARIKLISRKRIFCVPQNSSWWCIWGFNVPDPVWEEGTRKREMESHLLPSSRVEEFLIQIKWKLLRSERDAWKGLMKDACDDAIKAEEKHFVASQCGVELKRERIFLLAQRDRSWTLTQLKSNKGERTFWYQTTTSGR